MTLTPQQQGKKNTFHCSTEKKSQYTRDEQRTPNGIAGARNNDKRTIGLRGRYFLFCLVQKDPYLKSHTKTKCSVLDVLLWLIFPPFF